MRTREGYGRIVAGCVLCAGAAYAVTGCTMLSSLKGGTDPVAITYAQDGRATFVDAKGQGETVLTIGQGSMCTGSADGKKTYRQFSCWFQPGKGTVNGEPVTVYWNSLSATARRGADDAVTHTQTLGLRVVKSGAGGYDCASSEAGVLRRTVAGQVAKSARERVTLTDTRERPRPAFATSPTCSVSQKASLEAALAELRSFREIDNVACW